MMLSREQASGRRAVAAWVSYPVFVMVVAMAVMAVVGCGPRGPVGTIWVSGTVLHDGKPLSEGAVHFLAKDRKAMASGSTRLKDGKFGLYIQPGDYSLAVVSEEGGEQMDMKTGLVIPAKSRIPRRYTTVTESGLEAKVDAQNRTLSIVLEGQ
jgi:hypothetical protein